MAIGAGGSVDIALPMLVVEEAAEGAGTGADQGPCACVTTERADRGPAGSAHQGPAARARSGGGAAPGQPDGGDEQDEGNGDGLHVDVCSETG